MAYMETVEVEYDGYEELHRPMKRISVFLKESQLVGIMKKHEETGMPMSEIIRRSIDEYLDRGTSLNG